MIEHFLDHIERVVVDLSTRWDASDIQTSQAETQEEILFQAYQYNHLTTVCMGM